MRLFLFSLCMMGVMALGGQAEAKSIFQKPKEDHHKKCATVLIEVNRAKLGLDVQVSELGQFIRKYPSKSSEVAAYQKFANTKLNQKLISELSRFTKLKDYYTSLGCEVTNWKPKGGVETQGKGR